MQKSHSHHILSLIITLTLISGAGMAKTFKWVDGNGGVHYTQVPPYNRSADLIDAGADAEATAQAPKNRTGQPDKPAASEEPAKKYNALVQDKADAEARKKAEAMQRKQTKEACEALRNNLKILKENAHIRIRSNDHEKPRVLTPEERAQRIKQYNDSLNSMCK